MKKYILLVVLALSGCGTTAQVQQNCADAQQLIQEFAPLASTAGPALREAAGIVATAANVGAAWCQTPQYARAYEALVAYLRQVRNR